MNKYIKLLVESFFDDIEDDIADTSDELNNINVNTVTIDRITNAKKSNKATDLTKYPEEISPEECDQYVRCIQIAKALLDFEIQAYSFTGDESAATYNIVLNGYDYDAKIELNTRGINKWRGGESCYLLSGKTNIVYQPVEHFIQYEYVNKTVRFSYLYIIAQMYNKFGLTCNRVLYDSMKDSMNYRRNDAMINCPDFLSLTVDNIYSSNSEYFADQQQVVAEYLKNHDIPDIYYTSFKVGINEGVIFPQSDDNPEYVMSVVNSFRNKGIKNITYNNVYDVLEYGMSNPAGTAFLQWAIDNKYPILKFTKSGMEKVNDICYKIISRELDKEYHIEYFGCNYILSEKGTDKKYGRYVIMQINYNFKESKNTTAYIYKTAKIQVFACGKTELISNEDI